MDIYVRLLAGGYAWVYAKLMSYVRQRRQNFRVFWDSMTVLTRRARGSLNAPKQVEAYLYAERFLSCSHYEIAIDEGELVFRDVYSGTVTSELKYSCDVAR